MKFIATMLIAMFAKTANAHKNHLLLLVTWNGDGRHGIIGYRWLGAAVLNIEMGRLKTASDRRK